MIPPQPRTPPGFTLIIGGCYFLTSGGYILSATNGGGDIGPDAMKTNVKYSLGSGTTVPSTIGPWELFNVFQNASGQLALQTCNGNFVTAVNGGGLTSNVLHTDAVNVAAWEKFRIAHTGAQGVFSISIQTNSNNFLTAVGAGGHSVNAIHSDAKAVAAWETFFIRKFLGIDPAQYFIVDTSKNQAIAARNGGGQTQNTLQFYASGSNVAQAWARFTFVPNPDGSGSYALRTINGNYVTAVNGGGMDYGSKSSDNIHTDATIPSAWEQFRFIPSGDGSWLIQTVNGHCLGKRTFGGSAEGEYSTNANFTDIGGKASTFWLIPTNFF